MKNARPKRLFTRVLFALLVLGMGAGYAAFLVLNQIRVAKTYDTLSFAILTAHRTLYADTWKKGYDLTEATKREFPHIKTSNGKILDEWGKPLLIEIKTNRNQFEVTVTSAGKDGRFGTADDLTKGSTFDENK